MATPMSRLLDEVSLEHFSYPPATPEEIEVFVKMRGSMTQGWTGSFDKLEALLASAG